MKVCVIGGTGNISTPIVDRLLEQGHEVVCFNRGQSGQVPEDVRVITGDRKDREAFETAMQAESFDAAIDMICFDAEDARSSVPSARLASLFCVVRCSIRDVFDRGV